MYGPVVATTSGMKYIEVVPGTGAMPSPTHTVTLKSTGWLTDGTQFDSSSNYGAVLTVGLSALVPGWVEGVFTMRVGGRRRLIIPANLAYGDRGLPPRIPPGATLIVDVELVSVP